MLLGFENLKFCKTEYKAITSLRFKSFCSLDRIGRSENKSTTQFSLFENELGPEVINTPQDFSFPEIKIFVLI